MATQPPQLPSDWKALIPSAGSSWCTKILATPGRIAVYLYNLAAWVINSDGTATDDLKAWLGISTSGVTAPTNLTASDGTSETEVTVAWTGVSGATSYQIWRSNTNDSSAATVIGSSITTTFSDTSVTLGTVYYYFARTVATSGTSGFSNGDAGFAQVPSGSGSQTFNSSDSFVVPAGVTSLDAEVWAAGGNGGARGAPPWAPPGTYSAGGGGGGGEYGTGTVPVTPAETLTLTITSTGSALLRSSTVLISCVAGSAGAPGDVSAGAGGAGGTGGSFDGSVTSTTRNAGTAGSAGSGSTGGAGGPTTPVESGAGTGGNGSDTASATNTSGLGGRIKLTW